MGNKKPKNPQASIYKIKDGPYKNTYCVIYIVEQRKLKIPNGKVFVWHYIDKDCTKPFIEQSKQLTSLYEKKSLIFIRKFIKSV